VNLFDEVFKNSEIRGVSLKKKPRITQINTNKDLKPESIY